MIGGLKMSETRESSSKPHGVIHTTPWTMSPRQARTGGWSEPTGIAWVIIAIVILRFNYATVATIAVLFGGFCFVAAANEVVVAAVSSSRGWRILHWLLAVLFVIVGVVAFFRPTTRSPVWLP